MRTDKKQRLAERRHRRMRQKVVGTGNRPRMSVCFTGQHIYVQFIDDEAGRTLAATSTRATTVADRDQLAANTESAKRVGKSAAEVARAKGIDRVVFDRGTSRYHGKVKALAEAAREAGLQF